MEKIKKKLGFGMMRLPMDGDHVDRKATCQMVDEFIDAGFNYFDTARPYLQGDSERAFKDCVSDRYPRDAYIITNKMSQGFFDKEEDIRPMVEDQLKTCGVDYFDFYLLHAQNKGNFGKYKRCHAYETAFELKKEGKVRHVGLSFHDSAEFLEEILDTYPEIEVVQLQLNYLDFDDPAIQSRKCLEVCQKRNLPVIVMEPVKGGSLANLPKKADEIIRQRNEGSPASYAIRFAAGTDGVMMTLSGMSNPEQMQDNLSYMKDFQPLNEEEHAMLDQVMDVFNSLNLIPCTACHYCTDGCPQQIHIPDLFAVYNQNKRENGGGEFYYNNALTKENGKASDCIECGQCEDACPQHLPIRELLKEVAAQFEKN